MRVDCMLLASQFLLGVYTCTRYVIFMIFFLILPWRHVVSYTSKQTTNMIFFLFSQKVWYDISCKLSAEKVGFSKHLLKFSHSMLCVKACLIWCLSIYLKIKYPVVLVKCWYLLIEVKYCIWRKDKRAPAVLEKIATGKQSYIQKQAEKDRKLARVQSWKRQRGGRSVPNYDLWGGQYNLWGS